MESERFDDLTRGLANGTSRRHALKVLGGSLLGGVFSLGGRNQATAAGPKKQALCHRTGNPAKPFVVISVAKPAVSAHLAHGDTPYIDCCSDADCSGGDACSSVSCVSGQCVTTDVACSGGDQCHQAGCDLVNGCTSTVTPGVPCTVNDAPGTCDDDGVCQPDSTTSPTCAAGTQCGNACDGSTNPFCTCGNAFDDGTSTCYLDQHGCAGRSCGTNADCADVDPSATCLSGFCTTPQLYCSTSADCGAGFVCIDKNLGCGGCDEFTGGVRGICNPICPN